MNFKNFEKDPLYSELFVYWYNDWISTSNNIKKGSIGIEYINIRIIINDLINEYELNSFKSNQNRKVYISLIQELQKKFYLNAFQNELKILKSILEIKPLDKQSCYLVAKKIKESLDTHLIKDIIINKIIEILDKKKSNNKIRRKLTELNKDLLVELVTSGVKIDDILLLFRSHFETYIKSKSEKIILLYQYIPRDIVDDNEKIEFINNLTLKDRIYVLKNNLNFQKKSYTIIFPIFGVKVFNKYSYREMEIYNPERERLEGEDLFENTLLNNDGFSNSRNAECHVKIEIESYSLNSARNLAEKKLKSFINLINLYYATEYNYVYTDGNYQIKQDNGWTKSILSNNMYRDQNILLNVTNSFPFKSSKFEKDIIKNFDIVYRNLTERKMFKEISTIDDALNNILKSNNQSNEDRLLSSWIVLEGLSSIGKKEDDSSYDYIKSMITSIYMFRYTNSMLNNIFLKTASEYLGTDNNKKNTKISDEFAKLLGLNRAFDSTNNITYNELYRNIFECKRLVNDIKTEDEIDEAIRYFENNKVSFEILKKVEKNVSLTIDYIYKCRNQIVHNGYIDENLIPYLVKDSESYARTLFFFIIGNYLNKNFDIVDESIKYISERDTLYSKLINKSHVDIYKYLNDIN